MVRRLQLHLHPHASANLLLLDFQIGLGGSRDPKSAALEAAKQTYSQSTSSHQLDDNGRLFQTVMRELFHHLPDERREEELLRPLNTTAETLLRDIAIRTRVYSPMLEAWERLHFEVGNDSVTIRNNVVASLRLPGATTVAADYARAVYTYDYFRSFLAKFANVLFPWVMPFFPDHMTLHAGTYTGGRGIVFTAGNDQAKYLDTSIRTFRSLGCNLPIEILYLGEDDLSEEHRDRLEALDGVVTRDLRPMIVDDGWKIKGDPTARLCCFHTR